MKHYKFISVFLSIFCLLAFNPIFASEEKTEIIPDIPLSPATKTCIGCHSNVTPGIVKDWLTSRHSKIVASAALEKPLLEKGFQQTTCQKILPDTQ